MHRLWNRRLLLALVVTGLLCGVSSGQTIRIALQDHGDIVMVNRQATSSDLVASAVEQLLAGPTAAEAAQGLSTAIPAGTSAVAVAIQPDGLAVDLSDEVLVGFNEAALESVFNQFRATLAEYSFPSIRLTNKGQLLGYYLPPAPVIQAVAPKITTPVVTSGLSGRNITIGPSHGRFYNGSGWYWQRGDPCGFGEAVLEDTNSIRLMQFLNQYLTQDGATVHVPRDLNESDCCDGSTGLGWWKMCAQVWLHHAGLPCSVWAGYSGNCGADAISGVNRSSDDIRARPLFADYRGSDIYIACHTNAGGGTGTETYRDTQMEHPEFEAASYNLATSVHNAVIASIQDMYDSAWVSRGVKDSAAGFGEIRVPSRPAILIELAFHDHCTRDGVYLVDDFFRSVAEWGLYNGVCTYFGTSPTWGKYSCEVVSDTIPTVMNAGQSYGVSVTFRNRGVLWNDAHSFRLGANGDSDPFTATTRFNISGDVKPGATYTWNFTLTAPTSAGTYTTDWRMVRDGVSWFGPTISKQVTVLGVTIGCGGSDNNHGGAIGSYDFDWTGNPTSAANWGTKTCSGDIAEWYTYGVPISGKTCTTYDRNLYWSNSRSWAGRGHFNTDVRVTCSGTATAKYVLRNSSGGDTGTQPTLNECPLNGWYNILNSDWTDLNITGWRTNPNIADAGAGCNSNCGYPILAASGLRMYGARWQYINDWTCLGGYGSSSVSDTSNRNFTWGESGLYLYPAMDTSHGNTIGSGLGLSGKNPGRVLTGDCNNANSLNFKGNAAAYGGDNMDAYGFAWAYTPGGAGPKFLIGSDDGNRVWVNGTLINDNDASRGLARDQDETGSVSMGAGWNRILFKVHNGTGGFEGAISLRNGSDKRWNEPSVNAFDMGGYYSYALGYEQDSWYPCIDVASFYNDSDPAANSNHYGNDTTITASGAAGASGAVPFWKVMQYQWGYGIDGDSNYADVTSSGVNWSHTETGVTGHRRFHFFAVSRSGRTSFQNSGIAGGSNWGDTGPANYLDVYVDNVAPQNPSLATASVVSENQVNLSWALPLDQGVNIAPGADEAADETSNTSANYYRRGDVGAIVYRDGAAVNEWSGAGSLSDQGLSPNTAYTYTIEARDNTSGSRGDWHNATGPQGSTTVHTLIETPLGVTFANITQDSIEAAPAGDLSNLEIGSSGVKITNVTAGTDSGYKQDDLGYTFSSLTANTEYSFVARARNSEGVETADSIATTAWTLPVPPTVDSVTAGSGSFCLNDPIAWTAVDGFGAGKVQYYRYAWNQDSTYEFTGTEDAWSASDLIVQPVAAGTWYLHVQSCNGADVANGTYTYSVEVSDTTAVTGSPADANLSSGDNVTLTASGSGAGVVSYKWQVLSGSDWTDVVDGGAISGANTQALQITGADDAAAGQYRCVITGSCGAVETLPAEVTIAPKVAHWYSVKTHGSAGEFARDLNPEASPIIETRQGDLKIRVVFDKAIEAADGTLDAADVTLQDSGGNAVVPSAIALVSPVAGASQTLEITVPEAQADGKRLTLTLPGVNFRRPESAKALLLGSPACQVRCLIGDVNYSGNVNTTDMSIVRSRVSDNTPVDAQTCVYDLNCSGSVTIVDMSVVKMRMERTVP